MSWGEIADTKAVEAPEEELHDLPPPEITTNEQGNKIEIVYIKEKLPSDNFKFFKTIRETRSITKRRRWSKRALDRQANRMSKFGDCQGQPRIPEKGITAVATEEISFEFAKEKSMRAEQQEAEKMDMSRKTAMVVCKFCKSTDHFSAKCPMKHQFLADAANQPTNTAAPNSSQYLPPHLRAGTRKSAGGHNSFDDEEPTIRISNIPEHASQDDMRALMSNFRHGKFRLARRGQQAGNKGYAFVTFNTIGDAYLCMQKLNNHKYGYMVLKVEWSDNYKKKFPGGKPPVSEADKRRAAEPMRMSFRARDRGYGGGGGGYRRGGGGGGYRGGGGGYRGGGGGYRDRGRY